MTDQGIFSLNGSNDEQERLGVYDDFAATENRPADFVPGLVSLGFIKAAIRRSIWFLAFMCAVGLIGGFGYFVKYPRSYQASASVLLTMSPYEDLQTAINNNNAMAKTAPVAMIALRQLGLQESPSSFLNTYAIASVTDRVLAVTASASSSSQAVLRAGVVGNAFLTFRADEFAPSRTSWCSRSTSRSARPSSTSVRSTRSSTS